MDIDKFIPACVAYDPFQVRNLPDVRFILQHEIDLFEEGQDGALSEIEIGKVRKALAKVAATLAAGTGATARAND